MSDIIKHSVRLILAVSLLFSCEMKEKEISMEQGENESFLTSKDILSYLDSSVEFENWVQIDIGNEAVFPALSKIHLYSDQQIWCMVYEKVCFQPRYQNYISELIYFGNGLGDLYDATSGVETNYHTFDLMSHEEFERCFNKLGELRDGVSTLQINGQFFSFPLELELYENMGMFADESETIDAVMILRHICDLNKDIIGAGEDEIRSRFSNNKIEKLLTIDQWYQKDFDNYGLMLEENKPSNYETYKMIAKVLVTGDVKEWNPTLKPNSHWENWPDAGSY